MLQHYLQEPGSWALGISLNLLFVHVLISCLQAKLTSEIIHLECLAGLAAPVKMH